MILIFLFTGKSYSQTVTIHAVSASKVYALGLDYVTITINNPTTQVVQTNKYLTTMEVLMPDGRWLEFNKTDCFSCAHYWRPVRKNESFSYTKQIAFTTLLKNDSIAGKQLLLHGGTISLRMVCYIDRIKTYSNIFQVNVLPLNSEDIQVWDYCKTEGFDINILTTKLYVSAYSHTKTYQYILQCFPNSTFATIADFILTDYSLGKRYLTKTEKAAIKQKLTTFLDSPFPLLRVRAKRALRFHFSEEE